MTVRTLPPSSSSSATRLDQAPEILGSTEPRIFTPPLRELKPAVIDEEGNILEPTTSYGFAVIDFARDVLGTPLDEWEEWAVIHGGELLPSGKPRFRKLLIIVGRQNGKTFLLRILVLFWLFVERWALIMFISNDRNNAKRAWRACIEQVAFQNELLKELCATYKTGLGQEEFTTTDGCEFGFAAPTGKASGRSRTIARLILDELREHDNREVWSAAYNAMNAQPFGQVVCASNQGTDRSVMLNELRDAAHEFIKTGKGDKRLGIIEYSAPKGSSPLDPYALAMANPNLGRRIDVDDLVNEGARCLEAGGKALDDHLTEVMGIRIRAFDGAIDPNAWEEGGIGQGLQHMPKNRLVAFLDMSWDNQHVALVGACVSEDSRVHVERLRAWVGPTATADMQQDLSGVLKRSGVRQLKWFSGGPMKAVAPWLRKLRVGGVVIDDLKSEMNEVCMHLAQQVEQHQVIHKPDGEMTDQVTGVFKNYSGKSWNFLPVKGEYADFAYAVAGAVWLARTMPRSVGPSKPILVTRKD